MRTICRVRCVEQRQHRLTHLRYRGWSVPVFEVDSFLNSGALTPAMFELFVKLLIPYLPATTVLRNVFDLRRNRCSLDTLRGRKVSPKVQIFPYLSNSKNWALFIVDKAQEGTTLRKVMPETYAEKAFEHVIQKLITTYDLSLIHISEPTRPY